MLCLSILSSTASATWNLNTLSKGEVYMVVIPEHVSFVCPYGYTNGGFLAIEQTVNPVSSSDICCARTTVAIQVNKGKYGDEICFHNFNSTKPSNT